MKSIAGKLFPIIVLLLATVVVPAVATHTAIQIHPDTTVSYVDNTGGAIIEGVQNGQGVGVEGVVGATPGAIGMLGYLDNASNQGVGMEGLVDSPSSTGLYGQALNTTGAASVGLLGTSTSGVGVWGETLFNSTSSSNGTQSVFGIDGSSSGSWNSGVYGKSTNGFGVTAQSLNNTALYATSATTGNAVYITATGTSNNGLFVSDTAPNAFAVVGGVSGGSGSSGLYGYDTSSDNNSTGLYAYSINGEGAFIGSTSAGASCSSSGCGVPTLQVENDLVTSSATPDIIRASGYTSGGTFQNVFDVRANGSALLRGSLTQNDSSMVVTHTTAGREVASYGARSSVPTIEDFGEGYLYRGRGTVALDPTFGSTIDPSTPYLVFITPRGDNRGLYIESQTREGFTVRESQGGSSTLAFDYRIIARPYLENRSRLPDMNSFPEFRSFMSAVPGGHRGISSRTRLQNRPGSPKPFKLPGLPAAASRP
jgi:hypothetical protein